MDLENIKKHLPNCELSELKPCTVQGKVQFHLLVEGKKEVVSRILDIQKLADFLKSDKRFKDIKYSAELGVVKAKYSDAGLSILASGRVVVKEADGEKQAKDILGILAPYIKKSLRAH